MIKLKDYSGHGAGSSVIKAIIKQSNLAVEMNALLWVIYVDLIHEDDDPKLDTKDIKDKLQKHFEKVCAPVRELKRSKRNV